MLPGLHTASLQLYEALRSLGHLLQPPQRDPATGTPLERVASSGSLSRASSATSTAAAPPATSEAFWEALKKVGPRARWCAQTGSGPVRSASSADLRCLVFCVRCTQHLAARALSPRAPVPALSWACGTGPTHPTHRTTNTHTAPHPSTIPAARLPCRWTTLRRTCRTRSCCWRPKQRASCGWASECRTARSLVGARSRCCPPLLWLLPRLRPPLPLPVATPPKCAPAWPASHPTPPHCPTNRTHNPLTTATTHSHPFAALRRQVLQGQGLLRAGGAPGGGCCTPRGCAARPLALLGAGPVLLARGRRGRRAQAAAAGPGRHAGEGRAGRGRSGGCSQRQLQRQPVGARPGGQRLLLGSAAE